jgi:hypothetical protein
MSHGAMAGNPSYKASKALKDYEAKLERQRCNGKNIPLYRQYLL